MEHCKVLYEKKTVLLEMRRVCDRNEVVWSFPGLPEELCEKWVFTGAGVGWESQDERERSMCSVYTANTSRQLSRVCGPIQTPSHQCIFNNFMSAKRLPEQIPAPPLLVIIGWKRSLPCLKMMCEKDHSSQYAVLGDCESWLAGGGDLLNNTLLTKQDSIPC